MGIMMVFGNSCFHEMLDTPIQCEFVKLNFEIIVIGVGV